MTKTTRILSAFVAMILLLSALGCGGGASGRAALYGKWEYTDASTSLNMQFEFKQDGTLTLGASGITFDLKYEFVDDDTIKLVDDTGMFGGDNATMDFKVEGDKLSLTSQGQTQVLTKVK